MVDALLRALLFICGLALIYFLVVWVLRTLGFPLPEEALRILMVMFVLVAILVLWRLFSPIIGGVNWWGTPRPPGT